MPAVEVQLLRPKLANLGTAFRFYEKKTSEIRDMFRDIDLIQRAKMGFYDRKESSYAIEMWFNVILWHFSS